MVLPRVECRLATSSLALSPPLSLSHSTTCVLSFSEWNVWVVHRRSYWIAYSCCVAQLQPFLYENLRNKCKQGPSLLMIHCGHCYIYFSFYSLGDSLLTNSTRRILVWDKYCQMLLSAMDQYLSHFLATFDRTHW